MSLISPPPEKFHTACFDNATSHAVLNVIGKAGGKPDLGNVRLHPSAECERGVSDETRDRAMTLLNAWVEDRRREEGKRRKPWWRFW